MRHLKRSRWLALVLIVLCLFFPQTHGQTAAKKSSEQRIVPIEELMQRAVQLRPELKNVHPRLFFTADALKKMRERAAGADRELWLETLKDIKSVGKNPPDPRDEELYKSGLEQKPGSISQYSFAFEIAQTSFAYAINGDENYLRSAKAWTLAACEMPIWGYTYNKPNVDLPPAHLLYAVAFAYDVLFEHLTAQEKLTIKNKLLKQGRLMYEHFRHKPNKRYTYSQNHTWIPMAGLGIAAYALMDESDEVKEWAKLSRGVYDRTMLTFAMDGYFYESFHYFGFAFRWMIRYFDAHLLATGENLYEPMRSKFDQMKYFAMHSVLPDRENIFDLADTGDGALNRTRVSKREKLYGEYDILYRFASVYQDPKSQRIADFIRKETKLETREPMWAFINHDANVAPAPLSQIPTQVYFNDNDTVFWRSDWSTNATAFVFRCSPPEGHYAARLAKVIPDWRQNSGHAHPDANSFIIYAKGKYLTGDTGYLGIKNTDDHNTVLINNRGQARDGVYEMFKEVPNDRLDNIRIAEIWGTDDYFYVRGEAASAYYEDLGLKKFDRHFLYIAPNYFVIWDELETSKASKYSFLLNADRDIELAGIEARLINENVALRVVRVSPQMADSVVVPQMVEARGLPGSVDKGKSEQRGVQLQTVTTDKQTKLDFLHLLEPISLSEKAEPAKIAALNDGAKGLKLIFPNGDREYVCLSGSGENIKSDATRLVVKLDAGGLVQRMIFQNGRLMTIGDKPFIRSPNVISASLRSTSPGRLNGWIFSKESTEVQISSPIEPKVVKIGGLGVKFKYDAAVGQLNLQLPAGRNFIETE